MYEVQQPFPIEVAKTLACSELSAALRTPCVFSNHRAMTWQYDALYRALFMTNIGKYPIFIIINIFYMDW